MEEVEQHINCLELKAAILAFKAFLRVGMQPPSQSLGNHPTRYILLEMDNTTTVAYVNWRGHSVTISVPTGLATVVLPADPRFMGDSLSLIRSLEYGSRHSFEGIQHAHREDASEGCLPGHHHFYVPEIDLFASHLNHQLPLYVSQLPNPDASVVYAFQDGDSGRVSSTHQWCYYLEIFRSEK